MTNGKKKGKKEEPVKLEMSFEDAMRLALKTSPSNQIILRINEKQEIKGASNRIIELISIELLPPKNVPDAILNASNLGIEYTIKLPDESKMEKSYAARIDPYKPNMNVGYFNLGNTETRILIPEGGSLFLSLVDTLPNSRQYPVEKATLTYISHVRSKF
ncbi:MAG TPA: hypothetical protein PKL81_13225 [Ferruginibacter sp.]|jgi:hypothetical protein|nr:hypothetical protein [Ferruginibacter sp.]HNL66055.1 hypothetical protein [Ferruginibacter sp.]HNN71461.1 hypothetical protein [Ferruginibacter sp.]HNO98668.1 hypothetical protein [Ferruginibacter sp.]